MIDWLSLLVALVLVFAGVGIGAAWVFLKRTPARREPRPPARAFPPLQRGDYRRALCVGEEEIWWRAVHTAIETQKEAAVEELHDLDNQKQPALLHYYAGHAQALVTLAEFLRSEREAGMKGSDEE